MRCAKKNSSDVAVQLKSPASIDGAEGVENHPHRAKGDAHNVAFRADLTAEYNIFKEAEMACVLRIIGLAHNVGE